MNKNEAFCIGAVVFEMRSRHLREEPKENQEKHKSGQLHLGPGTEAGTFRVRSTVTRQTAMPGENRIMRPLRLMRHAILCLTCGAAESSRHLPADGKLTASTVSEDDRSETGQTSRCPILQYTTSVVLDWILRKWGPAILT
jgi:hypothetical protein